MSETGWNPWKLTAIGMAHVTVTAVVTGIVVAHWAGTNTERNAADLTVITNRIDSIRKSNTILG